jgi:hypothetical protein
MNVNGAAKKLDGKPVTMLWRNSSSGKQAKFDAMQMPDDWQETSTLLASLEKIESWMFSRIVDTVWWQVNVFLRYILIDTFMRLGDILSYSSVSQINTS